MEIDVAARARAGVRLKRPHQPVEQPVRPRRAARLAQADAIDHEQLEQRHRIGAFPLARSEEHTSELQSLMRISYAVFCLKKKKNTIARANDTNQHTTT